MDESTIQPAELKALIDAGRAPVLLDVRQPEEAEAASIAGAVLIPMPEIPARSGELDRSAPTVVYCHHGIRSAQVAAFLKRSGFADVRNLAGGIEAWSTQVDPSVPRYRYDGRRVMVLPGPGR
jgi:rhodanese-related sulfurtransferase